MFLNTLAITDRVMQRAIDKSKNGHTEKDNSGKTGNRTYPETVLESVKNYIKKSSSDGISVCARKKQISIFSIWFKHPLNVWTLSVWKGRWS